MTYETPSANQNDEFEKRPLMPALMKGARGRCPSCGVSHLFTNGLTVQDKCHVCGEEFHHHRADDLPAYLNIFIVGHIVVAATMIVMDMKILSLWPLVSLSALSAVALAFLLMRPLKGMVVGLQWALRMHGFGGHDD
ncbi:MAG: DUF983 domain-containing protein [Pseudomonadota bacterium]